MYITADEYEQITSRPKEEATEQRIRYASHLLDARIGPPLAVNGEFKLDLSSLNAQKRFAVMNWVAWMVSYLADHNDTFESFTSISLGRYSETKGSGGNEALPSQIRLADHILVGSGLVNRRVRVR